LPGFFARILCQAATAPLHDKPAHRIRGRSAKIAVRFGLKSLCPNSARSRTGSGLHPPVSVAALYLISLSSAIVASLFRAPQLVFCSRNSPSSAHHDWRSPIRPCVPPGSKVLLVFRHLNREGL
jgi:hypothetical protein